MHQFPNLRRVRARRIVHFGEGFRTPAAAGLASGHGAGVRKPSPQTFTTAAVLSGCRSSRRRACTSAAGETRRGEDRTMRQAAVGLRVEGYLCWLLRATGDAARESQYPQNRRLVGPVATGSAPGGLIGRAYIRNGKIGEDHLL